MADEHHGSTLRLILDATPKLAILLDRIADTTGIERQLRMINRRIDKVMATEQEALDAIATLKGHVDSLRTAIENYIASNPGAAADFQKVLDAVAPIDTEVTDTTGEVP